MCGIAGSFSINGRLEDRTVRDVLSKLKHRGPDANGFFNSDSKTLTLLHSRLSIIDLNARSNQPFHSSCGRFVMVYNGELYNFNELIREMNMRPKTSSDTEVVLEVFLRYGIEGVAKFDGMFAFAIYDKQDEVVWMARDRIGEKPLYYSRQEGFAFASELKALLPMLQQLPKINHSAVRAFLHVGYVPAAQSIYDNIFKFPAGSYGVADLKGNLSITRYWNISEALSSETISDEEEALTKLEQLVTSSVSSRLVSDVPYGAFLSGGVDSSLVCAIASRLSDSKLNTFSIGFENKTFDETYYSKSVAAHLGTNHHEFLLKEMQAVDLLDNLMEVYDEPFADSSAISTLMVASLAAPHVKMVLSGDGGDELFHGYGSYMWANRLEKKYIKAAGKLIRATLRLHPSGRAKRVSPLFGHTYDEGERNHIFSQESYFFSNEEIDTLMIDKVKGGNFIYSNKLKLPRELLGSEKQAIFDLEYYLPDDLLVKVDRSTMSYGLECRVPLLSHHLIEYALNIDPTLKINKGGQKYLLKQLVNKYLPSQLFDRPKWGFGVPIQHWLKNELKWLADEFLSKATIEKYDIIDYGRVNYLQKRFNRGENYLYNRLWAIIVLHWWLKHNQQ